MQLDTKYYCEVCNFVAFELDTIKSHLKEESHANNKAKPPNKITFSLVRRENFIKVGESVITIKEWQGIIGMECVLCHTWVKDEAVHTGSIQHMANLTQARVKCDNVDQYYREVSFYHNPYRSWSLSFYKIRILIIRNQSHYLFYEKTQYIIFKILI